MMAVTGAYFALAAKPGGGGGGGGGSGGGSGGGTGGGTIYFAFDHLVATMNSDGSGKSLLPIDGGEPSQALHGGHRWFLQVREIPGETYPSSPLSFSNTRRELFAYRDDGNEQVTVQLTDQPDLENKGGNARWAFDPFIGADDGIVSWIARRWDLETGEVIDGGIYAAQVDFDPDTGDVLGLVEQPLEPLVPRELVAVLNGEYFTGDPGPDIGSHDWAPDGTEIVHDDYSGTELWVADAFLGLTARILATDHVNSPVWSPDGSRIAFNSSGGIDTIAPDGSSRKLIIKWGPTYSVGSPRWSPTGSHLIYSWWNRSLSSPVFDIYRATAGGGGRTNLTKDIEGFPFALGWR
jgi:hypothetical protein